MGLFQKLLGGGEPKEASDIPVAQVYFVGNNIKSDPVEEAIIIIGNFFVGDNSSVNAEDWEWSVIKCNEPINVPKDEEVKLYVHTEGDLISGGRHAQSHLAWLMYPEEAESLTDESASSVKQTFPFPDELRGQTIPEGTKWEKEDLEFLLLSFAE